MDGSENGHVSGELLRLMDQHLMGSRYSLPHLPPNKNKTKQKKRKGHIHSGGRVGGHETAAVSFDGRRDSQVSNYTQKNKINKTFSRRARAICLL